MTNAFRNFYSLSTSLKNRHVFNIIGSSQDTLNAIYDISFILYASVPYSVTTNVKYYYENALVPSYYKDLKYHITMSDSRVILNKFGMFDCKELTNIQNYVDTISTGKWRTSFVQVIDNKNELNEKQCEKCGKNIHFFALYDSIENKIKFVNKLLS